MKTKKYLILILICVVVLGGIIASSIFKNDNRILKIGIILPLTGDVASIGEYSQNGAMLAYNQLPEKTQEKIKLYFEDDQFKPVNTTTAFNKLAVVDKVNMAVCLGSTQCGSIAPIAEEKQIPLIAVASDNTIQKDKKYVFRLEIAPQEEAKRLLAYLQLKQYERIASVVEPHGGIQTGYSVLKESPYFSEREQAFESVKTGERDFRTPALKIFESKPDAVFLGLLPGNAGLFAKELKTLGFTGDFVGFNFIEGEETLTLAQGTLEGAVYTQARQPEGWFEKAYSDTYKVESGIGAAHLFDAITISGLLEVDKKIPSKEDIAQHLNTLKDFNGALGNYSSTGTHEFSLQIILKTIKDNKFAYFDGQ